MSNELPKDVQAYMEWQADQFMVPDIRKFTQEEATEYVVFDEWSADKADLAGWYARLSAPGYLDATEWTGPYDTEAEAAIALFEMFGDDMPDSEDE